MVFSHFGLEKLYISSCTAHLMHLSICAAKYKNAVNRNMLCYERSPD